MPDDARVNGARTSLEGSERVVLRNEFAIVNVSVVGRGPHRRLRIEDQRAGVSVELDALELECLAWAAHRDLAPLLDPNATRWRSEDTEGDGA
jgi:hypothetical protein